MSLIFKIHTKTPQSRLVGKTVSIIKEGGIVVYPTDATYAIGCQLDDKKALEKICHLRGLDKKHNFSIICRDLKEISKYAIVESPIFRFLKSKTPGPYTFVLRATKEIPRRLMNPKRKTIGLRIPDNNIVQAILAELDEPMVTTTLILPQEKYPLTDPDEIYRKIGKQVDLVIDGGLCTNTPTTLIDLTENEVVVLREGIATI